MPSTEFLSNAHVFNVANSTNLAAAEDMYNANIAGDVISLKNAQKAVFMIQQLANGSGGNASVYVRACDDATPSNTSNVTFYYKEVFTDVQGTITESQCLVTSTAANCAYMIEVDAAEVQEKGYDYVQLYITEKTNAAVDGCIFGFIIEKRFSALGTQLT